MRTFRLLFLVMAFAAIGYFTAEPAFAGGSYHRGGYHRGGHYHGHRGGLSFSVAIGSAFWAPYYPYYAPYYPYSPYAPYYYLYEPEVIVPSVTREYIQRPGYREPAPAEGIWYFCPKSNAYYPYVNHCENGWQTVPATPPSRLVEPTPARGGNWYFCPKSNAYYPYVKECPDGWQTTPAQPSSGPGR